MNLWGFLIYDNELRNETFNLNLEVSFFYIIFVVLKIEDMIKRLNLGNINEKAIPILEDIEKNSVHALNDFATISIILDDLKKHYVSTDKAIESIETILMKYEY